VKGIIDYIHKNASGQRNFDMLASYDALHRLKQAKEGTLSWSGSYPTKSGSIANTAVDEQWTDGSGNLAMDQLGNWRRHRKDRGNNGFELDSTNTFSAVNELLTRDTNSSSPAEESFTYDAVGNLTDDGDYEYTWDVFGRLVEVFSSKAGTTTIKYRHNGLGFMIGKLTDTNASGGADSSDDWQYFAYTEGWQQAASYTEGSSTPDEVFAHHAAGLNGYGGSSYIDNVLFRYRGGARNYYCHNWRNDISVLLTSSGSLLEWVKYSAYGEPFEIPPGDPDSDGDLDYNE
jgi:YD repeat-containing protein